MTAEVAILNRGAVVIAADSAITLGGPSSKIYNTANKLFALSRAEPIAVMVYGAALFEEIPWETVIKEYRRELALTTFDTVEEYAQHFTKYLSGLKGHFPTGSKYNRVQAVAQWELMMLCNEIEKLAERNGLPTTDSEIRDTLLHLIGLRIDQLETIDLDRWFAESVADQQIRDSIDDWKKLVDDCLAGFPVTEEVRKKARILVSTSLMTPNWSPWSSGVVIAGFGRTQMFPALSHYLVDGVVADVVRAVRVLDVQIGEDQSAGIYPFAQQDMVQTFMYGLNPGYRRAFEQFVDETINLLARRFSDLVENLLPAQEYSDLMDKMEQARVETVEHFQDQLGVLLETENSQPIMSIVDSLPKEDLAEMAEALVNLTSLKRRVTPDEDTVGGPVDVAVISKGDGFIWIKRKHYFRPELNIRYFERDRRLAGAVTGKEVR